MGEIQERLIVGLGNPETEYADTRHNLGFACVRELARRLGAGVTRKRWRSLAGHSEGSKVWLVLPQTYMNLSGQAVSAAVRDTGVEPAPAWVGHDQLVLQPRRRPWLRGACLTAIWESSLGAAPELMRWLNEPAGRLSIARLPRAAWPIVVGSIARSTLASGRPLLVLVQSPDRFAEELRPWLAGRPSTVVFAGVAVSFLDRPPAFDPAVSRRLEAGAGGGAGGDPEG